MASTMSMRCYASVTGASFSSSSSSSCSCSSSSSRSSYALPSSSRLQFASLPRASFSASDDIASRIASHLAVSKRQFDPLPGVWNNRATFRPSQQKTSHSRKDLRVTALFGLGKAKPKVAEKKTVVPEPSYLNAIILLGAAGALVYADNLWTAVPVGLVGLLLLVQTKRVRFVFTGDSLDVKIGEELEDSGENVFVGGENSWKYATFTNWEVYPSPSWPLLVYFKENQTKPEGQIHFFPVVCNWKQIYNLLVERCGPSQNSGPK